MFILTIGGVFALLPPVVYIFNHETSVFGVPQIVFYLFGVWLLLIAATAGLTRLLRPEQDVNMEVDEG